ncbi:MAG: mechanosensitive ion channel protein MscS [Legionellaceae bacterium]|nr:mechanosensitive ion channel protein MscS [Legionellaceae bacterium]HAF87976.1 mechanosensitive ion channel protein MscS [Legionellales bacterium]HCA89035.1 mechanosensitive ion channel protein MscS [Legionellales bacterium]|tara:strand:+ start:1460 stop:2668 length:1209 start_codon:yes stop_codon:yes gene_type:complete
MIKKTKQTLGEQLKYKFITPLALILLIMIFNYSYQHSALTIQTSAYGFTFDMMLAWGYWVGLAFGFFWLAMRLIDLIGQYLAQASLFKQYQSTQILLPFLVSVGKTITFLMICDAVLPHLGLPPKMAFIFEKLSSMLIIGAFSWILFKFTHIAEQLLLVYATKNSDEKDVMMRKLHTQALILRRIANTVVIVFTIGACLMLFDNVRALGASVLTTAGVIGLVFTFAAQRSLTSLFSGLEIALTQPIKLGDTVIIENELGVIEEINFRNVVIKLWDWRRLIVPTNYFLEKPFQNWSREQANRLIGTVYLYADFALPMSALREEFTRILQSSAYWDKDVSSILVTDTQDKAMQIRAIASAASPGDAWTLRCEIREKLIQFIAQNYPDCLPKNRTQPLKDTPILT